MDKLRGIIEIDNRELTLAIERHLAHLRYTARQGKQLYRVIDIEILTAKGGRSEEPAFQPGTEPSCGGHG